MKPFVFTLMPFDKSFDDIYKLGIKATCEEAGAYCERVDEQQHEERILDRIYNQINKADIIVADMTGKNANVFYEVGYSHAFNKRVILLTQSADDIPFDLKHHSHIVYNNSIVKLKEDLYKKVKYFIDHPLTNILPITNELEYYIHGKPITTDSVIEVEAKEINLAVNDIGSPYFQFELAIDIHNSSRSTVYYDVKLAILTEKELDCRRDEKYNVEVIKQPDLKLLHIVIGSSSALYPGGWIKVKFGFRNTERVYDGFETPVVIRAFSELGVSKNIEFKLKISGSPYLLSIYAS